MIYIITGSINSGKTTKLLSIYKSLQMGDGFVLPKIFIEGNYTGQQILRLSTGKNMPFSFKKEYIPDFWDEKDCYGIYSFSQKGFDFAYDIIDHAIHNNISPIFIDEIGPLELQEKGFYHLLSRLSFESNTIYIAVRDTLLKNVINKFNIKDYEIIRV